jgi:plastocyanin
MLTRRGFLRALLSAGIAGIASPALSARGEEQDVKELRVKLKRYDFTPSVIRVKQGDRVRLYVEGVDIEHGLYIDGYDLSIEVGHVETKVLEFTADKAGTFRMRCSVVCGPLHPFMVGKLVVEPDYKAKAAAFLGFIAPLAALVYFYLRREVEHGDS